MKTNLMTNAMIELFELDPDWVVELQMDNALDYLEGLYPESLALAKAIAETREFWHWWIHQIWGAADASMHDNLSKQGDVFVYLKYMTTVKYPCDFYARSHHNGHLYLQGIRPNDVIIEKAVKRLYGELPSI